MKRYYISNEENTLTPNYFILETEPSKFIIKRWSLSPDNTIRYLGTTIFGRINEVDVVHHAGLHKGYREVTEEEFMLEML